MYLKTKENEPAADCRAGRQATPSSKFCATGHMLDTMVFDFSLHVVIYFEIKFIFTDMHLVTFIQTVHRIFLFISSFWRAKLLSYCLVRKLK